MSKVLLSHSGCASYEPLPVINCRYYTGRSLLICGTFSLPTDYAKTPKNYRHRRLYMGREADNFHLMLRLRMRGTVPPLPY